MGFLRDHRAGFIGGARNRTLQNKAGAPWQWDLAACQGKASGCGTKRRIQKRLLVFMRGKSPRVSRSGGCGWGFLLLHRMCCQEAEADRFSVSRSEKTHTTFFQVLSPFSSLLALGHLCQHPPLPVGLAELPGCKAGSPMPCPFIWHRLQPFLALSRARQRVKPLPKVAISRRFFNLSGNGNGAGRQEEKQ